jgi:hypothetical protein
VSLFVPVAHGPSGTEQTRLRIKNLVADARRQLVELDADPAMLAPLEADTEVAHEWPHEAGGVAVFASPAGVQAYSTPHALDELVVVAARFHLRPLLRRWQDNGEFLVLALSHHSIRLLRADRWQFVREEVEGLPELAESSNDESTAHRSLQFHSDGTGVRFHGNGDDDAKEITRKFVQDVARAVDDHLAGSMLPLVLACVDYLHPMFRAASHYDHLVDPPIVGNHDGDSDEALWTRAWSIVEDRFRDATEATDRWARRSRQGRTVAGLHDALEAAAQGRIETLFVRRGAHAWGRVQDTQPLRFETEARGAGTEDLFDRAALLTLRTDGQIVQLSDGSMPSLEPIAATLRYVV